jgi:chromosome segregation ATPase
LKIAFENEKAELESKLKNETESIRAQLNQVKADESQREELLKKSKAFTDELKEKLSASEKKCENVSQSKNEAIESYEKKLINLGSQISELNNQIESLKNTKSDLESQIQSSNEKLDEFERKENEFKTKLESVGKFICLN